MKSFTECRKFYSILVPAFAVGLFFFSVACSGETTKRNHLARGEEYLQKRKYQEAAMEFRSAADIDKNSAEAHWGLARVREGQGDVSETVSELRQVIALDPKNLHAKVKLGNYFLLYNPPQIPEAEKAVAEILAADPLHIEAHILKASLLSAQNKSEKEILDVFGRAIAIDPNRVESHLSLARFFMKTNRAADAENAIKKAISVGGKSPLGYLEYGRFFTYTNRPAEAEAEFKKAIAVAPADLDARETLAAFYLAGRQIEKAEQAYKDLAQAQDNSPEGRTQLANFYALVGRETEAVQVFEAILEDAPEYARARYRLGEIYLERREPEKVAAQIEKLLAANDTDAEAILLRARMHLQENKLAEAIEGLTEILKKQPAAKSALFYMAQAQLALGENAQARAFIGDLDKYHPKYPPTGLLKVQMDLAAGENEKALQQANELLATLKAANSNVAANRAELEQLRIRALSLRGQTHLALNSINAARADLREVLRLAPASAAALTNLARTELAASNYAEALNLYEKAFAADRKNFDALAGIVAVYKAQRQFAAAREKIDRALAENSASNEFAASLYYLKADVYIAEKDYAAAERELRAAIDRDENYLPAYSTYAALLVEQNQTDRAVAQYQTIIEKKPSAAIYTVVGMLEDARANFNEAEKNYRKALEIAPNQPIAANNLAWLIADTNRGNLDEALQLAQKSVDANGGVAGFYDTLGTVYFKKGLLSPAVEQLRKAVALDEAEARRTGNQTNPGYRVRLARALASAGDKPNARREVETALRRENSLSQREIQEARSLLAAL